MRSCTRNLVEVWIFKILELLNYPLKSSVNILLNSMKLPTSLHICQYYILPNSFSKCSTLNYIVSHLMLFCSFIRKLIMVVYSIALLSQQKDHCKFEDSLCYIVSSRPVTGLKMWATTTQHCEHNVKYIYLLENLCL